MTRNMESETKKKQCDVSIIFFSKQTYEFHIASCVTLTNKTSKQTLIRQKCVILNKPFVSYKNIYERITKASIKL